jgi:hypothetical protein
MPRTLPARLAAVAVLGMLTVGGVAAAANGLLPGAAARAAKQPSASTAGNRAAQALGDAAVVIGRGAERATGNATGRSNADKASGNPVGPDASGNAKDGLCRAWQVGHGDDHGRRADSPAFHALAVAAGGADQIAAYCQTDVGSQAAHGKPTAPPDRRLLRNAPPGAGSPPGSGDGQGHGGPPTDGRAMPHR